MINNILSNSNQINMNKHFHFLIMTTLFLVSCKATVKQEAGHDPLLLNCWKHVHEEDKNDGALVFKSCDQEFGPAMYRENFVLTADGKAQYLIPHPADAHYMGNGTWTYDAGTNTVLIADSTGVKAHAYEIVEVEKTKLLVRVK